MSMKITLPEHIQSWIDQQVAEGRYDSTDAVIAKAVEQAMDVPYRWEEDEDLLEAIAEYERDGGETVTDIGAYLDRLSREAMENAARGHEVSDDIKY